MALQATVTKSLPIIKRIALPLLNLIGNKNEYRIIVTSPDYIEFDFLWGLIRFEKGERKEFVIRGTETYVTSVVSAFNDEQFNAKSILVS